MCNNNGPDSTGRRRCKSPYLWLSINYCHSTVTVGEASWPSQSRTGGTGVYKKFSSPACHIQGNLRLHLRKEDESSSIRSQGGSWASRVSMQMFTRNWGWSRLPLQRPIGGQSGHSPCSNPPSDKRHTRSGPVDFLSFYLASSALQGPLEVVGVSEQPKAVFY